MDLDTQLTCHKIINFEEYVNTLLGEEIYELFWQGVNLAPMHEAMVAWRDLGAMLKLKYDKYIEFIQRLSQYWWGETAEWVVNDFLAYGQWLRATASAAWTTALKIFLAYKDQESICSQMISAEALRELRLTAEEQRTFARHNGVYASRVALLEQQYEQGRANNIKCALDFYRQEAMHVSKLPPWPALPGCGF